MILNNKDILTLDSMHIPFLRLHLISRIVRRYLQRPPTVSQTRKLIILFPTFYNLFLHRFKKKKHFLLLNRPYCLSNSSFYRATHENDSGQQHIYTSNSTGDVDCFTCNLIRVDGGLCLYNEASVSSDGNWLAITCAGPEVPQVYIYSDVSIFMNTSTQSTLKMLTVLREPVAWPRVNHWGYWLNIQTSFYFKHRNEIDLR